MSSTSIRVSEEAKQRLDRYKREGESYEDVIMRLTEGDHWAGFGALSDSERSTHQGMQKIRERMREGTAEDIEP